jgi:hypothetical protein
MQRTTVFADEDLIQELRDLARREGKSLSQIIREALERAVAERRVATSAPSILGIGRSGRRDVAERHEELLWRARRSGRRRS